MKVCSKCRIAKPKEAFTKQTKSKDGLQFYCRECMKEMKMQSRYKCSHETFKTLMQEQNSKCAICGIHVTENVNPDGRPCTFCVDHDHTTGDVRGLLCHACNLILGNAKDSTSILQSAIWYLQSYKAKI